MKSRIICNEFNAISSITNTHRKKHSSFDDAEKQQRKEERATDCWWPFGVVWCLVVGWLYLATLLCRHATVHRLLLGDLIQQLS
jgi:hypothetical protein